MTRRLGIGIAAWTALVGVAFGLALSGLQNGPRAYFAAWLALSTVPLGALPLLMILDLFDVSGSAVAGTLRRLLASLPVMTLLALPFLLGVKLIFPWAACHHGGCTAFTYSGWGARWFVPSFFVVRGVLYLAFWLVLSLYFLRPARSTPHRRTMAVMGLIAHLFVVTLAAFDWVMSVDAGHVSANTGVIVMAAQASMALVSAVLLLSVSSAGPSRSTNIALVVAVCFAAFTQFVEFLVVWSANLPKEIAWYLGRASGGSVVASLALPCLLVACALLLPRRLSANRLVTAGAAAIILLVGLADLLLLASPAGTFANNLPESLLALFALGGLAWLGAALLDERQPSKAVSHA